MFSIFFQNFVFKLVLITFFIFFPLFVNFVFLKYIAPQVSGDNQFRRDLNCAIFPVYRNDIRVRLYPQGLHNVESSSTHIFMYFRDFDDAMNIKNGEFIKISSCRFERDLSRSVHSWLLFTLSFPISLNPTLRNV